MLVSNPTLVLAPTVEVSAAFCERPLVSADIRAFRWQCEQRSLSTDKFPEYGKRGIRQVMKHAQQSRNTCAWLCLSSVLPFRELSMD